MASHRIGARVSGLSPEQLCAIIEAQAGASDAALRVADEHATRLVEQPEWILSEVLLSPDLAPHILAQLPTKEHAAKGTCRAWRRGWKETLSKRERPRLLVVGGLDNHNVVLINSSERYDLVENAWEEEAVAPMPTARMCPSMALFDDKLYAVGGVSGDYELSNSVEWYDLATKVWEAVAPMATARAHHDMAVLDGKLYAVGGLNASVRSFHERVGGGGADGVGAGRTRGGSARWQAVCCGWGRRRRLPPQLSRAVRPGCECVGGGRADGDPRDDPGMAVLDGKLYAVGGYGYGMRLPRSSGTTRPRTRGRRWRRWWRLGISPAWRFLTASCMQRAARMTRTATATRWSGTTRPQMLGREWRR